MTDRIRTLTFVTNLDGVTVQLDRAQEQPGRGAHFAGQREFMGGPGHIPGLVQRVHVMSSHAFGEIRSYVLDETRVLRLAGPATADLTYAQYAVQNATPLPATYLATVADLRRGQWACLSATGAVLVRIRHADPQGRGTRVEWDHGHGTKATVRHMPSTNPVQVSF